MARPATFEMPTSDGLTGLLSVDYFRYLLREQALPAAHERDEPLSLFLLDLDNFMALNRQAGREQGDEALKTVAALIQDLMPQNALLVRYSGDEFAGALPELRIDDAFTLLEELRRRVVGLNLAADSATPPITCSVGLAAFPAHGRHEAELMRQADEALYVAKQSGRNKVALPLADSRMVTKTSYYTQPQLARLADLAKTLGRNEASILREALDDVLKKYNDRLKS